MSAPDGSGAPAAATIRHVRPQDLDALYAISLATGDSGGDAAHLYEDPRLMGHIYAAPYAVLAPELVLVAEDEDGVGGYVLGVFDTLDWADRLEREWWPHLRERYPDPGDVPPGRRTADQRRAAIIHRPETPPAEVVARFPAHIHMNLLPRLQGRGLGTRLLETWLDNARTNSVTRIHVGVNRGNAHAVRFWRSRGFREIGLPGMPEGRTVWMGMELAA